MIGIIEAPTKEIDYDKKYEHYGPVKLAMGGRSEWNEDLLRKAAEDMIYKNHGI